MYLAISSPSNLGFYARGIPSPSNLGFYMRGVRSPGNLGRLAELGFFRPNQAFDRGIYGLGCNARCRRRRGLGQYYGSNPPDPDTVTTLVNAGYDPITIQGLVAQGASDEQLQNLPYGPGTTADDMGSGVFALTAQLGGAPVTQGQVVTGVSTSGGPVQPLMTGSQFQSQFAINPAGAAAIANANATGGAGTVMATVTPQTVQAWLMSNAWWLLGITAGIFILPPLLKDA
jgi:hypothetical protein